MEIINKFIVDATYGAYSSLRICSWLQGRCYRGTSFHTYLNNTLHGKYVAYRTDGRIMEECTYQHNHREGQYIGYDINGCIDEISNYKNDDLHGAETLYKNGSIVRISNYVNGQMHGYQFRSTSPGKGEHYRWDNKRVTKEEFIQLETNSKNRLIEICAMHKKILDMFHDVQCDGGILVSDKRNTLHEIRTTLVEHNIDICNIYELGISAQLVDIINLLIICCKEKKRIKQCYGLEFIEC